MRRAEPFKICAHPGCERFLRSDNLSGICKRKHPKGTAVCAVPGCASVLRVENKLGICKGEHPGSDLPGIGAMYNRARRLAGHAPRASPKRAESQRARVREFIARVDAIKLARGCTDCGYRDHAVALDFDHARQGKLFNVSNGFRYAWSAVELEIVKCDVVCSNCHRVRTRDRRMSATVFASN